MLALHGSIGIYIATSAIDMRRSFDSLSLYIQETLSKDPLSGQLFVFFNKRHDRVKILYWDHNGLCLWCKRLEEGVFRPPRVNGEVYSVTTHELTLLLEGIELTNRQRLGSVRDKLIN
jgi:transposase